MESKHCSICDTNKPILEFSPNKRYKDGFYKHCKKCHYSYYGRNSHFKRTYGITEDQYNAAVLKLDNKCQVCNAEAINSHKWGRLVVDHCHDTGNVRGYLCQSCNMTLGSARDNPDILRRLANYLENHYDNV